MDNKEKTSIGFQLRKITTEQFAIIQDSFDSSVEEVNMSIGIKFGTNTREKFIASFVKVQFEQNNNTFLIVEIANHFEINDKSWEEFNTKSKKIIIPKGFATHLVMITAGTLRGVLHSKTENTEFNKFFLPTINVVELIDTDIELDLD